MFFRMGIGDNDVLGMCLTCFFYIKQESVTRCRQKQFFSMQCAAALTQAALRAMPAFAAKVPQLFSLVLCVQRSEQVDVRMQFIRPWLGGKNCQSFGWLIWKADSLLGMNERLGRTVAQTHHNSIATSPWQQTGHEVRLLTLQMQQRGQRQS